MYTEESVVIVGGCGHVGLPLGLVLAHRSKARVTLLDIDAGKVEQVNAGQMPFMEDDSESVLNQVVGKHLHATVDPSCLRSADVVITVVGTPVDGHLNPTVSRLCNDVDLFLSQMKNDSLLILRSTVYPGVTRLMYDRIKATNRPIHLAFAPERIAEGKALKELVELPQIVAAFEKEAQTRARNLFLTIAPSVIDLDPLEAELAKLFTNSWRYINFAISNQFYMLARNWDLDFNRIHEAITQDYPRMRSFARAGFAAGPCLLKDTLQLSTFAGNNFFLGHAAMLINEGLPNFIINELRSKDLTNRRVAILGMAFKAESDDKRESLSYKLRKLLQVYAREVICTDPFVVDASFVPLEEAINRADIIILAAPHAAYRYLRFPPDKILMDIWGFWNDDNVMEPVEQIDMARMSVPAV